MCKGQEAGDEVMWLRVECEAEGQSADAEEKSRAI